MIQIPTCDGNKIIVFKCFEGEFRLFPLAKTNDNQSYTIEFKFNKSLTLTPEKMNLPNLGTLLELDLINLFKTTKFNK